LLKISIADFGLKYNGLYLFILTISFHQEQKEKIKILTQRRGLSQKRAVLDLMENEIN